MSGLVTSSRRKSAVIKRLELSVPVIRSKFGVTRIGIFGSFARGDQTRKSDVDILVDFAEGYATLKNFIGLSDYLESMLRRNVDLLTEPSLSSIIRPYIERDVIWIEG